MELVYLWVEEYKNIYHQGFNFSPRFECKFKDKYDENGRLKGNCELIIEENKNYISIFPENINVTAIIGENGSGKSSVLEIIFNFLYNEATLNVNFFLLYQNDNTKYLYQNKITVKKTNEFNYHHLNNDIFKKFSNFISAYINNVDNEFESKENLPKQLFVDNNKLDINFNSKIILSNYLEDKNTYFKGSINKFFIPNKVQIKLKYIKLNEDETINDKYNLNGNYTAESLEKIKKTREDIKENLENKNYKKFIENIENFMSQKRDFVRVGHNFSNGFGKNGNFYNNDNLASKYKCKEMLEKHKEIIKGLKDKNIPSGVFYEWDIDEITKDIYNFIDDFPTLLFDIELYDGKKSFQTLSFGERQLLIQLNKILHYAQKLDVIEDGHNKPNHIEKVLILLDEFEVGLHPNWQKYFVSYLVYFLKEIKNKNFQIIFTSHSPFILSDLPKDNVVFLKKDEENGNCINDTNNVDINPFGANIHTLLSHGFFMQDGLMGEFAKNKISKILKFLNGENKFIDLEVKFLPPLKVEHNFFEKNLKPIIGFIGEDFLKEKLLRMYEIKFPKSNEAKIKELENEIKRLKNASN
ncbi:AAA family ATPase [Halarcobacter ebronensis]|uniref:AAA+ ATPase domain-containing protein n=1 Tax=Halarcobacter ebronensis TaxID=1462615 RepID=A0A4Q1AKM7_9BACT|nr:AAA family ATPase [Halarcobacter ebronensis]QKF83068.1 ATP-binding protein (AAA domain) [Halarcobacter ebronensis]RXK02417.1 hypothetical protein CRV07_13815 [Halarcobacter ebronensis]